MRKFRYFYCSFSFIVNSCFITPHKHKYWFKRKSIDFYPTIFVTIFLSTIRKSNINLAIKIVISFFFNKIVKWFQDNSAQYNIKNLFMVLTCVFPFSRQRLWSTSRGFQVILWKIIKETQLYVNLKIYQYKYLTIVYSRMFIVLNIILLIKLRYTIKIQLSTKVIIS